MTPSNLPSSLDLYFAEQIADAIRIRTIACGDQSLALRAANLQSELGRRGDDAAFARVGPYRDFD